MKVKSVISSEISKRISAIHQLSARYNGGEGQVHQSKLLELMRHHIEEIETLAEKHDPHFLVETGDLMMLCFELLIENAQCPGRMIEQCCGRYEQKLTALIAEDRTVDQ